MTQYMRYVLFPNSSRSFTEFEACVFLPPEQRGLAERCGKQDLGTAPWKRLQGCQPAVLRLERPCGVAVVWHESACGGGKQVHTQHDE